MEEQIINIGSLSSISNLNFHLIKELEILRESYLRGEGYIPVWDMTNIVSKKVSFSALTAFLSISKTIRDFIGRPIEIRVKWLPDFQGFLHDVDFIKVAVDFDLFDWKGMLGGFKMNTTSPNTKIFYYNNIPEFAYTDIDKIINWKDSKREEIKRSIHFRLSAIFNNSYFIQEWNKELEAVFTTTISELVVNSLIHGRSAAFVGVQRTRKGITTCICDSGIGFLNSIVRYKPEIKQELQNSNLKAILYSSFHSKNKIGLYRAISDVIKSKGHVTISSFDSEIFWTSNLWEEMCTLRDLNETINYDIISSSYFINKYTDIDTLKKGYFRKYESFLVGSRITFEIPFSV